MSFPSREGKHTSMKNIQYRLNIYKYNISVGEPEEKRLPGRPICG
jgi:hypothetical protein